MDTVTRSEQFYMAPMEGLTGYVFRNAYSDHYAALDKYFTPFIASTGFSAKEKRDVKPENNAGKRVVPQILTNSAEDFLFITRKLAALGYEEVNLNLGCPSGTVVSRGRGSGFLNTPIMLGRFFEEVMQKSELPLSLKIRIGVTDEDEWPQIKEQLLRFPFKEIIVHPRLRSDFYEKPVHMEIFQDALASFREAHIPVVYNGDIHSITEYYHFKKEVPSAIPIMLGRGLLKTPDLAERIDAFSQAAQGKSEEELELIAASFDRMGDEEWLNRLFAFHDTLLAGYEKELDSQQALLYKLKEVWVYLGENFPTLMKERKQLLKSKNIAELKSCRNVIYSKALRQIKE